MFIKEPIWLHELETGFGVTSMNAIYFHIVRCWLLVMRLSSKAMLTVFRSIRSNCVRAMI